MGNKQERFTVWHGLLLAEGSALVIALLMPVTPSKTGSIRRLAEFLIPDPSYLQEVLVYFVLTNLLILIVVAILWLLVKFSSERVAAFSRTRAPALPARSAPSRRFGCRCQ